jgi:hypothetical protein
MGDSVVFRVEDLETGDEAGMQSLTVPKAPGSALPSAAETSVQTLFQVLELIRRGKYRDFRYR